MRLVVLIGALMGMISSLLVFQIGPGARLVRHVPRRPVPAHFRPRSSDVSHAGFFHLDSRLRRRHSRRLARYRHACATSPTSARCSPSRLVAAGVLILRYREPNRQRAFRAPGGPLAPILTIMTCLLLMAGLPIMNWIRFFVWLAIGLVIYFTYSRKRSTLRLEPSN